MIWIAKNYQVRRFLLWNMVCRSNWLRDLFICIFMLLDSIMWFMYTIYKRIHKCSKRSSKWNTIKCVKCLFVFLNAFGAFAGIVCISLNTKCKRDSIALKQCEAKRAYMQCEMCWNSERYLIPRNRIVEALIFKRYLLTCESKTSFQTTIPNRIFDST